MMAATEPDLPYLLTPIEARRLLRCGKDTLAALVSTGAIRVARRTPAGHARYFRDDVLKQLGTGWEQTKGSMS